MRRTLLALSAAVGLLAAQSTAKPKTSPSKKPGAKVTASASAKKKTPKKRARLKPPPVSAKTREVAYQDVTQDLAGGASIPVENVAALIPFFEQLYRHQRGELEGPLHVLHYGDSHSAADEWTGDIRSRFQMRFGDGGSGYSFAGRPWNSYRRLDVKSGSSRNWRTDGLVGRPGDGLYGLGGVSMSTNRAGETVYLIAEGQELEIFYLQQPGGGSLQLYDNGQPVERISTDGDTGPGFYRYAGQPGPHRFELETLERAPVRLFGWALENTKGVTYETLGINGAQASIVHDWNEDVLRASIERRNPALIVLAYGTNEAGNKDWTQESYRDMFSSLLQKFRRAAPAASILVIGPPDRYIRVRGRWNVMDRIGMIAEAQREASAANGCAFWDLRAKMGGKGSMKQWVLAGMAQYDHVHFTAPGYRMLGDAVFRDLMSQYDTFLKVRSEIAASEAPGR